MKKFASILTLLPFLLTACGGASSEINTFAQCLGEKGAVFYGAFWCPHCGTQKEMFKNSQKLPYVECSTPDGKDQLEKCKEKDVKSYPTWDFGDGTRETGVVSMEQLAEKTGCALPAAGTQKTE